MGNYRIIFPNGFDDYAWEVESKGWLQGVIVILDGKKYPITFYDPVRLSQDIDGELSAEGFFFEGNLVVLKNIDRDSTERTIGKIVETGVVAQLRAQN